MGLAGTRLVPGIYLRLQLVALGEQGAVLRRQFVDEFSGAGPEGVGVDAGAGNCLVVDEVEEDLGDLQAAGLNTVIICLSLFGASAAWLDDLVVRAGGYYMMPREKSGARQEAPKRPWQRPAPAYTQASPMES